MQNQFYVNNVLWTHRAIIAMQTKRTAGCAGHVLDIHLASVSHRWRQMVCVSAFVSAPLQQI